MVLLVALRLFAGVSPSVFRSPRGDFFSGVDVFLSVFWSLCAGFFLASAFYPRFFRSSRAGFFFQASEFLVRFCWPPRVCFFLSGFGFIPPGFFGLIPGLDSALCLLLSNTYLLVTTRPVNKNANKEKPEKKRAKTGLSRKTPGLFIGLFIRFRIFLPKTKKTWLSFLPRLEL